MKPSSNILRHAALLLLTLAATVAGAQQQRFFNLTVSDIEIDSLLPHFTYAIPLGPNYADSTYEVEIRYPEFIDFSPADELRFAAAGGGAMPKLPVVEQQVVVERKQGKLELGLTPIVERDGRRQFLVSFMLAVTSRPVRRAVRRARAAEAAGTASRYAGHSVLATGTWAKVRVPSTGVYWLSESLVRQAGFTDMSRVKVYGYGGNLINEKLVGSELAEQDDLTEVPTCTVGGRRLFHARGPVSWSSNTAARRTRNPYSDYGYYFLTESDGEPLTVDSAAFVSSFYPAADDYHSLHEVDGYAWFQGGRNLYENTAISSAKTYTLTNTAHAENGRLSVNLTAATPSRVQVACNGTVLGTLTTASLGSYDHGAEAGSTWEVTGLQTTDSITLTVQSGGPVRLDYISMAYDTPRPAPTLSSVTATPDFVHRITNQDHHADGQADMVIIIPTSQKLLEQAQRLADFHAEHDSMTVRIVPADELYNEFSSGTPDASAYRRYMKMLYDRATSDDELPSHLLLFGDGVWDNRMLTTDCRKLDPDDYLLCFESENSTNDISCYVDDGWFTLLDDGEGTSLASSDKEDVAVGRFPVTTVADAQTVVDKTIGYARNKNAGAWQNTIMFMGDDGNNNLHMEDVDEVAEDVAARYPGYLLRKVMWDAYTRVASSTGNSYPEATAIIKQQQAAGALIMDYAGHGSATQMSHEGVLRISDFATFTNTNLPLWITASCDIMPFDGTQSTIGETCLLNSKGGAVAFYGTTRTVYANYNKWLNKAFMRHVLSHDGGRAITLGEAQRRTKNDMITSSQDRTTNKLQYTLLGDPALRLNLPSQQVVVDSIAGVATGGTDQPELRAGAIVTLTGHIEDGGTLNSGFNGLLTATVRDTRELVTCKLNDTSTNGADEAFTYYDRQKTIYQGTDSVRQGRFTLTFAVPRDINYADGSGLLNAYAVSDSQVLAHGAEDGFTVNGTEAVSNDSIGPSIYCYLNTPSFANGGTVNATPYFVAEVTDKDGINASGSGVGHDLQLVIDGDMQKTYNLNDNFQFEFGSYTRGTTYYNIPELEEGAHTLRFRAWDVLNNSSTVTLAFNVVKALQPEISSVSCTDNPATTSTTFIITHNFAGADVDLVLDVFDMSGRLLWQHTSSGTSTGNTYTVSWDLTTDDGHRLQTGVYLYRARLSSNGSSQASKAKKLVVINNN